MLCISFLRLLYVHHHGCVIFCDMHHEATETYYYSKEYQAPQGIQKKKTVNNVVMCVIDRVEY